MCPSARLARLCVARARLARLLARLLVARARLARLLARLLVARARLARLCVHVQGWLGCVYKCKAG